MELITQPRMSGNLILLIIIAYFAVLLLISFLSGRSDTGNMAFFTGNRQSPWWVVAIGMVGASLSGVSFVSVPGMVGNINFSYLQTVFGFFAGYLVIAHVLLPLYYRLQLTSIYSWLGQRLGPHSYTTGAAFFLLSKTIGAAARLYVVALILHTLVFEAWQVPFIVTVGGILLLIWLYTFRSGIKSIVWTDALQTVIMLTALMLMVTELMRMINVNPFELSVLLKQSTMADVLVWDDWNSRQHFVKQFFSGIFITIVMTGLDQDMMQKNLSCRDLKSAQKNMYWYGMAFIPVNFLFLLLGFLILHFAAGTQFILPPQADAILPFFAANAFSTTALLLFVLGIIAAAFSSADSALTALTTSFMVDILKVKQGGDILLSAETKRMTAKRKRIIVHLLFTLLFIIIVVMFRQLNNKSVIDAIFTLVGYTYGPLLGMYSFGLYTRRAVRDRWVPPIAVTAPLLCFGIDYFSRNFLGYAFGYELLLMNGALTFVGLLLVSEAKSAQAIQNE